MVVDQVEARLVEDGGSVRLANGETNGIGETLAKGTSGDLDTGSVVSLGMAGSDAVDLLSAKSVQVLTKTIRRYKITYTEVLQVVNGDLVAEEMD